MCVCDLFEDSSHWRSVDRDQMRSSEVNVCVCVRGDEKGEDSWQSRVSARAWRPKLEDLSGRWQETRLKEAGEALVPP